MARSHKAARSGRVEAACLNALADAARRPGTAWLSKEQIGRFNDWVPLTPSQDRAIGRALYNLNEKELVHINHASPTLRSDLRRGTLIACLRTTTLSQGSDQGNHPNARIGCSGAELVGKMVAPELRYRALPDQVDEAEQFLAARKSPHRFVVPRAWLEPDSSRVKKDVGGGDSASRRMSYREEGDTIGRAFNALTGPWTVRQGEVQLPEMTDGVCYGCHNEKPLLAEYRLCAACHDRARIHEAMIRENDARRRARQVDVNPDGFVTYGYEGNYRSRTNFLWSESYVGARRRYPKDSTPDTPSHAKKEK